MKRQDELNAILKDSPTAKPLIEEVLYLEEQLDMLRKLPKIRVNPNNPEQQKVTPAAKLYKEYLQQYLNALKILLKMTDNENESEDSPLRKWVKARVNSRKENLDT